MININHDPYPDQVIWSGIILNDGVLRTIIKLSGYGGLGKMSLYRNPA